MPIGSGILTFSQLCPGIQKVLDYGILIRHITDPAELSAFEVADINIVFSYTECPFETLNFNWRSTI